MTVKCLFCKDTKIEPGFTGPCVWCEDLAAIAPKYEDVVAQRDAAMGREAALREELAALRESYEAMRDRKNSIVDLQQRLTVAEQRESEAREELLDLSRKLDVFYSRSHGIKNLSAIEDANDKSKALQQRLTVAEQREVELKRLLCDVINEAPTGFASLKVDLANRVNAEIKQAAEPEHICEGCGSKDWTANCDQCVPY